jgi:DNA-binding IclR family transcriptional regulator
MTGDPGKDYVVRPVLKALKVLAHVADKGRPATLTEVASELGLPKTTAYRYLRTLSAAGFLERDAPRERYALGSASRALARADGGPARLREAARPVLTALRDRFNETVNLGILSSGEIMYVDIVEASRALRMHARVGDRHPVHSTALGRAILSHLPSADRDGILRGALRPRTARTTVDRAALEAMLDEARRRGFAVEVGENEDGAMCIGVPVLDATQWPMAAISLSAPETRMRPDVTADAIDALRESALKISHAAFGRSAA